MQIHIFMLVSYILILIAYGTLKLREQYLMSKGYEMFEGYIHNVGEITVYTPNGVRVGWTKGLQRLCNGTSLPILVRGKDMIPVTSKCHELTTLVYIIPVVLGSLYCAAPLIYRFVIALFTGEIIL